jgi:hypothetical protein
MLCEFPSIGGPTMSCPRKIPALPDVVLVWDGPSFGAAMREAGLDVHGVGIALSRHPEAVRRWTLPREHPSANVPHVNVATVAAAVVGRALSDLLVAIPRTELAAAAT